MDLDALTGANQPNRPPKSAEELELTRRALILLGRRSPDGGRCRVERYYPGIRLLSPRKKIAPGGFYEYGERVARANSSDVIETWYLCLVLGFRRRTLAKHFANTCHQPPTGRNVEFDSGAASLGE